MSRRTLAARALDSCSRDCTSPARDEKRRANLQTGGDRLEARDAALDQSSRDGREQRDTGISRGSCASARVRGD
jgi:hypothetical protein